MKIEIAKPDKPVIKAQKLLDKLKEKNNFKFNVKLVIDYSKKDAGLWYWDKNLVINPNNCAGPENSFPGYTDDYSIFTVIVHEFVHFLTLKYFKNFVADWKKTFKKKLELNDYATDNGVVEQIAEVGVLYVDNPYLLKLISEKHYLFFNKYFKSPTSCRKDTFLKIYKTFSKGMKKELAKKWGIAVQGKEIVKTN